MRAEKILRRYPDYSKTTPEYLAGIIEKLATFPDEIAERLASITGGICDKCEFLPTVASIEALARPWMAEYERKAQRAMMERERDAQRETEARERLERLASAPQRLAEHKAKYGDQCWVDDNGFIRGFSIMPPKSQQ